MNIGITWRLILRSIFFTGEKLDMQAQEKTTQWPMEVF